MGALLATKILENYVDGVQREIANVCRLPTLAHHDPRGSMRKRSEPWTKSFSDLGWTILIGGILV
jgi:hypothetical protein